jgi:hypothetical protein
MVPLIGFKFSGGTDMVQQKTMTLFEFHQRFPTEKECAEHLFLIYDGQMDLPAQDASVKNIGFMVAAFYMNVKIANIKHL